MYRKPYRIKRRKSVFRNRFFWLGFLISAVIGSIFYFLVFSSTFQIKEIKISGNQKVSTENLKNLIKEKISQKVLFFSSDSIFLANLNKISETILEKCPQVDKINFKRKFPDTLEILIEEKKPVAIFCQARLSFPSENFGGQAETTTHPPPSQETPCFLLDNMGIIFEKTSQKDYHPPTTRGAQTEVWEGGGRVGVPPSAGPTGLPKIIGGEPIEPLTLGKKIVEKNDLESILEFQRELDKNLKINVKEFILVKGKLTAITLEGWQIYFNPRENISEQILNLDLVLKEKISPENRRNLQYIDLRFGNRVYFKYRD